MHGRRRQTVDERDARRLANAARVGAFKALEVRATRARDARGAREAARTRD
jgi:hypothetical protein